MSANLPLWNENRDRLILPRRQRKIRHALDPKLIPHGAQVPAFIELDLVGDNARTELLVGRVLQVPAGLRLLDKASNHILPVASIAVTAIVARAVLRDPPYLQVPHRIAVVILGWSLPGDDVSAERGESQLENVLRRQGIDNMADGRIDDGDAVWKKNG